MPGVPALTSRAGVSLSFVFLTPPAGSRQLAAASCQPPPARSRTSWSQSGSSEHTRVPEFHEKSGGARSLFTVPVCFLAGAVRKSAHSPVQVATACRRPKAGAPSPFRVSSDSCALFHGSPLRTSILSAGDVHL